MNYARDLLRDRVYLLLSCLPVQEMFAFCLGQAVQGVFNMLLNGSQGCYTCTTMRRKSTSISLGISFDQYLNTSLVNKAFRGNCYIMFKEARGKKKPLYSDSRHI